MLPVLREVVDDAEGKRLVEQLAAWNGDYPVDSTAATLFNQLLFQIAEGALHDELGDAFFDSLIATRAIDSARISSGPPGTPPSRICAAPSATTRPAGCGARRIP